MARKRRMPRYASVVPDEDFFWRKSAERRLHLLDQARRRPLEWRLALMFKRNHRPESWGVGPNGFGRDVQFRISTQRNAAGYFVGWRSVEQKQGARSVYDYVADKDRAVCRRKTLERARRYALKRGNNAAVAALEAAMGSN